MSGRCRRRASASSLAPVLGGEGSGEGMGALQVVRRPIRRLARKDISSDSQPFTSLAPLPNTLRAYRGEETEAGGLRLARTEGTSASRPSFAHPSHGPPPAAEMTITL